MCIVEGCDREVLARNMCNVHYRKWQKYGNPTVSVHNYTSRGEPLRYLHEIVLPHEGDECLPWPYGTNSDGYGLMIIGGVKYGVHAIVCEKIHGPRPSPDYVASHKCGKGHLGCVNPGHLKWQTRKEDCADKIIHGTVNRGSRHGKSKLTEEIVREILSLQGKLTQKEIAKRFNVTNQTINDIMLRKTWGWLKD